MTVVSNDPSWWPFINASLISSYFAVAACAAVIYDWVLAFGQEVELIWRQRWSMMTVLYLIARYLGIGFVVIRMFLSVPTILLTDAVSLIMTDALAWASDVVNVILGVIMIARLHAMYQRSRKVLISLIVIFLAIRIADVVMVAITMPQASGEELVLSGTYHCTVDYAGDSLFLSSLTWIFVAIWEVLALCLAVWIAIKHFRELRRHSTRGIIGDCFTVLMKTHVIYFASFFAFACFNIGLFFPTVSADIFLLDVQIYYGFTLIFEMVQLSVLGPRLILSVREYHAKLVADSDTASAMTSIAFQERVHVETGSSV
ncbi:uncharacterized protein HD556DRAFT_1526299 [Suillus plorans]|uniref:DUF6533 domain-containing protein n=1 Tax=Suillus plorans TaxID=116603 RepID=A0A9P7DJS9_9AGAM|nr:uncharacterized protein HD556DRAFT_1526299 [Suillus plorans]KAG1796251.1 hypothetical protein HD556DRAFT_1526299 [Suillus plorans]